MEHLINFPSAAKDVPLRDFDPNVVHLQGRSYFGGC